MIVSVFPRPMSSARTAPKPELGDAGQPAPRLAAGSRAARPAARICVTGSPESGSPRVRLARARRGARRGVPWPAQSKVSAPIWISPVRAALMAWDPVMAGRPGSRARPRDAGSMTTHRPRIRMSPSAWATAADSCSVSAASSSHNPQRTATAGLGGYRSGGTGHQDRAGGQAAGHVLRPLDAHAEAGQFPARLPRERGHGASGQPDGSSGEVIERWPDAPGAARHAQLRVAEIPRQQLPGNPFIVDAQPDHERTSGAAVSKPGAPVSPLGDIAGQLARRRRGRMGPGPAMRAAPGVRSRCSATTSVNSLASASSTCRLPRPGCRRAAPAPTGHSRRRPRRDRHHAGPPRPGRPWPGAPRAGRSGGRPDSGRVPVPAAGAPPAPGDPAVPRAAASRREAPDGTVPWRTGEHSRPGGDGRRRRPGWRRSGRQPERVTAEPVCRSGQLGEQGFRRGGPGLLPWCGLPCPGDLSRRRGGRRPSR